MISRGRATTLTRALADRLPYPISFFWLRAQQAQTPEDVYRAAEGAIRGITALLLADVVHAPLGDETVEVLLGGADRRALERPSLGTRISLLRTLVAAHRAVPTPVLDGVEVWWARTGGANGALERIVQGRNARAHGATVQGTTESRRDRETALADLSETLRNAPFLRTVQLLHAEGQVRIQRGQQHGQVRRLVGPAPYLSIGIDASWPMDFVMEERRVYMGTSDGVRWLLQPFIVLADADATSNGHPRPAVFDTLDRRMGLHFLEPVSSADSRGEVSGLEWEPCSWPAFLAQRGPIVEAWAQAIANPPAAFVSEAPADLVDGLYAGATIDAYRLVQQLGEGGAAVVWEVEDIHDGQRYALKVLKSEVASNETEVRRFEQEVATMKKLYTLGCTRVLGPVVALRVDGRVVLRMPLMRGALKEHASALRAAAGGQNPDEQVVTSWLHTALTALAQLHANGVVHRDVKPSNFLLDDAGVLCIADLGVARDQTRRDALTRTNEVVGTDLYMAPEQRLGGKRAGPPADIYALAVCMDELWLGELRISPGKGGEGPLASLLRDMGSFEPDSRPTAVSALARLVEHSQPAQPVPVPAPSAALPPRDEPVAATSPNVPAGPPPEPRRTIAWWKYVGVIMAGSACCCIAPFAALYDDYSDDMPPLDLAAKPEAAVWSGSVTQARILTVPFTLTLCPAEDKTVTGTIRWTTEQALTNMISGGWSGNEFNLVEASPGDPSKTASVGTVKHVRTIGDRMIGTDDNGVNRLNAVRDRSATPDCGPSNEEVGDAIKSASSLPAAERRALFDQGIEVYIRQQGFAPGVESCVVDHARTSLTMEDVNTYFQSGGNLSSNLQHDFGIARVRCELQSMKIADASVDCVVAAFDATHAVTDTDAVANARLADAKEKCGVKAAMHLQNSK